MRLHRERLTHSCRPPEIGKYSDPFESVYLGRLLVVPGTHWVCRCGKAWTVILDYKSSLGHKFDEYAWRPDGGAWQ